jgi:hypothetical protein
MWVFSSVTYNPCATDCRGSVAAFLTMNNVFSRSNRELEHNYHVDVTGPAGGFMANVLQPASQIGQRIRPLC